MTTLFEDPLHEQLGTWPLAYIPYGGADYGEVASIAKIVGAGDDSAFFSAWTDAGDRMMHAGEFAESRQHRVSAHESYLRAACFYGKSFHPLFGEPVDPRVTAATRRQIEAFDRGLALGEDPATPIAVPFDGHAMPGYLVPARGHAKEVRPLLILTNGYDGTVTDLYFAWAVAAARRGYHCLMFDGPGQGRMLVEAGVRLRPDWETVIAAVVDFASNLAVVDPNRIALCGWSLGGYLSPRAASGEHRLAACIADPGQLSIADGFRSYVRKLGATPEQAARLGELPQAILDRMEHIIAGDRKLYWSIVRRGYWVNGVANLRDYLDSVERFTMAGRIEEIRCPTLFTMAEDDPIAAGTELFFDALRCPKTLMRMTRLEGAGDHCEMGNRSLVNRKVLDWLDEIFARPAVGAKPAQTV